MILVAGGTGTLGAHLVPLLATAGHRIRVLTRDERHADRVGEGGVEVVVGDVRNPAAVTAAVRGCRTVISAIHGFAGPGRPSPASIDRDGNRTLFAAAAAEGAEHVILVSVVGAAADHPMSLHRMKFAAEQDLIASGPAWTIIRSTAFMETWIGLIGSPLAAKGHALVFGPGDNPINFVSMRDVAAVVELAVRDPALRGETLEVGGPENLSFNEVARRIVGGAAGTSARTKHIPLPVLRAMSVLARPVAPGFARQARAAVVMNTTDLTFTDRGTRRLLPDLAVTTFDQALHEATAAAGS